MVDFESLGMLEYKDKPQYQKYLSALNKFIKLYLPKIKHTHVFVSGSFVKGKLHKNSDIDLQIIHPDTKKNEIFRALIDGVVVEYATFSFEIVDRFISGEYDDPDLLADCVSNWRMIIGESFPTDLVNKAKKRLQK